MNFLLQIMITDMFSSLDISLNGCESCFLLNFRVVSEFDEDLANMCLHLDEDLGQGLLANFLQQSQFAGTEKHLEKVAS